jgi:tetratricopeptide (TPR) repeat protein
MKIGGVEQFSRKRGMPRLLGSLCVVCVVLFAPPATGQASDAPMDVAGTLEKAAFELRDGRAAEALALLRRVESVEPGNPWLWYYQGAAQHALGDWYAALSAYDRASDLLAQYGDPDPELRESIRAAGPGWG